MQLYVVRRTSAWASLADMQTGGAKAARVGEEMPSRVRFIRTYIVQEADGRFGSFCIFEAEDGDAIREHASRVGIPGDDFYPVAMTVVLRADPVEAAAA